MKFTRMELLHWDIQANQVVVLQPGVNLLTGENGSGKTSILDAIKVVLGGRRIGGDRGVEDYLATQGAPYAMIRLVADNRPDLGTRRRPFDRVQPSEADFFTLAVVFQADDEGYQSSWYLCPGDVSPLARGFSGRAFSTKRDYTNRLEKMGMGRSFLTLLCTPQGQVASLCGKSPGELFDDLFDFIGGRQVLEEWESLRKDLERQQRSRDERGNVLRGQEDRLGALKVQLRNHRMYQRHIHRLDRANRALPLVRLKEAKKKHDKIIQKIEQLTEQEIRAAEDARYIHAELVKHRRAEAQAEREKRDLERKGQALDAPWRELTKQQARTEADHRALEHLRAKASALPERELAALLQQHEQCLDALSDCRGQQNTFRKERRALLAEVEQLEKGLLMPPEGVDDFRDILRTHEIPHHLLMDLIEPIDTDSSTRLALESYLGDLRFAVAVPDLRSFVRAIALARSHRFPFYVLSPDVRSRMPTTGKHPFLGMLRVRDPRYQGLINSVLRRVEWLEGDVKETLRANGVNLVDQEGFVLERKGGRYQGTERFYLGRDALEQRRSELAGKLDALAADNDTLEKRAALLQKKRRGLTQSIAEEKQRQEWVSQKADYQRLTELLAAQNEQIKDAIQLRERHHEQVTALHNKLRSLSKEAVREDVQHRTKEREIEALREEQEALRPERGRAEEALGLARAEAPEETEEELVDVVEMHTTATLGALIKNEIAAVAHFTETERDVNLPKNVAFLERQVQDVKGELARLDADIDKARTIAERAHEQYKLATRRVFRRYFALLTEAGERLGFAIQGRLRPRDDGRFDVDVKVAAGQKALVPYSSPSLSGGQKAALSMLMAMTTLRVHHGDGGAGFFLVDEPFSASDTHKIQELGAFLDKTGAQYIVSMPTSEELRRCGSWVQAVLTCTQTPGGRRDDGQLRIAPPVKCSYVVRNVE